MSILFSPKKLAFGSYNHNSTVCLKSKAIYLIINIQPSKKVVLLKFMIQLLFLNDIYVYCSFCKKCCCLTWNHTQRQNNDNADNISDCVRRCRVNTCQCELCYTWQFRHTRLSSLMSHQHTTRQSVILCVQRWKSDIYYETESCPIV